MATEHAFFSNSVSPPAIYRFLSAIQIFIVFTLASGTPSAHAHANSDDLRSRLILAQTIDPDRLKAPQAGRVCCVADARRFHTTAEACRLRGGAPKPLTACAVTGLEKPICCVRGARASWLKPSECKRSGGRPDKSGQRCRAVHVTEQVCCRKAGRNYATAASACRQAGGGIVGWHLCTRERVCCWTGELGRRAGDHVWTGPRGCRGTKVEPLHCQTRRPVCCKGEDGRLRIVDKDACAPRGAIRPRQECSFGRRGSIGPESPMGREICCARRGKRLLRPRLTCLSDGGREVDQSYCRMVCCYRGPADFPEPGLFSRKTTEHDCRSNRGRIVNDDQCRPALFDGAPKICCERGRRRFLWTEAACLKADGRVVPDSACR